jgi:predicted ATPase with chaperone activity
LDRIDLPINVPAVKYKELSQDGKAEESLVIRSRILAAREDPMWTPTACRLIAF